MTSSLVAKIETLLFASTKPLTASKLAGLLGVEEAVALEALESLTAQLQDRGVVLVQGADGYQLGTAPAHAELAQLLVKDEQTGELTRAALETLTIVAYRGPVARAEIEQIRGVNSAVILRTLQIRGLIQGVEDVERMTTLYSVTTDFVRHLGLSTTAELPDYEQLNSDQRLQELLALRMGGEQGEASLPSD
jgi:segregation and condensation protein B